MLAAISLAAAVAHEAGGQRDRTWTDARHRMVRDEIAGMGIEDQRVLDALRNTPRHEFVRPAERRWSYLDMALPIGAGQTISPPFVVAFMTQAIDPQPTDRVLEIGTGSGYQAAVLSELAAEVYSIEIVELLGRRAARTLHRLGYKNVHAKIGDGYLGWPEHAPFDKIIVTCSPESIPPALVAQLREGGTMVIPVGERYQQTLYSLKKVAGEMRSQSLEPTFFVPMTGRAEAERQKIDNSGLPRLVNGSFEESDEDADVKGWYYVRQGEVSPLDAAPAGSSVLHFTNQTPGRSAQALQAVAMDGRQVRHVDVSLYVKGEKLTPGRGEHQRAQLQLSFFDRIRAPVGFERLGNWRGTFDWRRETATVRVPVKSRLAVLTVGLLGAVGQLSVDDIRVEVTPGPEHGDGSRRQ